MTTTLLPVPLFLLMSSSAGEGCLLPGVRLQESKQFTIKRQELSRIQTCI